MPVDDKKQPIVIKRVKRGGHGHHGGAWKVAYADFVTAMMAFFLLMWLLGTVDIDTLHGISDVFQSPSAVQGAGGASTSMIELGGSLELARGEGDPLRQMKDPTEMSADELAERLQEQAQLDELMRRLQQQIEENPILKAFKSQLLLDITSEGLRIQIVDHQNRPMFDLGSKRLKYYTVEILHVLAKTLATVPNHLSLAGHTDATPFGVDADRYSNWELSADRANAARRELEVGGIRDGQFGRVVGLASAVLFDKQRPRAAVNRRISLVVLNRATERAIGLDKEKSLPVRALFPDLEDALDVPTPEPLGEPLVMPVPVAPAEPLRRPTENRVEPADLPARALPTPSTEGAPADLESALNRLFGAPSDEQTR